MMNPMIKQGFGSVSPGHSGGGGSGPMSVGNMDRNPLTPMSMAMVPTGQGQVTTNGPPANSISLAVLIDFIVQRTYHELTVLAELLPRKTDMERKTEIFNFAARTRLLAIRLLALVKWASSAAKVDKSVHIMNFLEKQSMLFIDTADVLSRMSRETLVHARLPNFHIPAAVEVLTTGTYNRLPTCIRERIVPPDPITPAEKKTTLTKLNQVIQHRLVTTELPAQMRNLKIEQGRVTFIVDNEFQVSLTVLGDSPTVPWRIIDIEILVEDKDIGDGMPLVHNLQTGFLLQLAQSRIDMSNAPLRELYNILHAFAQALQLEVLYSQCLKLCRERLGDYLTVEEYVPGRSLILGYWKELSAVDPKAELGYRLIISVDANDPTQPLSVRHTPPLPPEEANQTGEGLKTNQLEKILVHTIYLRSRNRLGELRKELELALTVECSLGGSPPVLSIPILTTYLRSEQLLVSVNIHTGSYIVHVPQFDPSPPVVTEIQQTINSINRNIEKLTGQISQLRYWITERRCEKTLQHLPASAGDRITLLSWDENPILSKIGPHRLTIKFQKHPYAILIVEFKEKQDYKSEMDYFFYLIMVKKASADEGEDSSTATSSSDTKPSTTSSSSTTTTTTNGVGSIPKFYLKPVTIIPLDTFTATHGTFTEVDVLDPSERIMGKRKLGGIGGSGGMGMLSSIGGNMFGELNTAKRHKHPAYFVPELAHIVALCDERLPFALMTTEFSNRGIIHGGCRVEANGTCLSVPIFQFPITPALQNVLGLLPKNTISGLHDRLDSAIVRSQMQVKGFRTWNLALKFSHPPKFKGRKIPDLETPVHFVYDMALSSSAEDHIPKIVDSFLDDWTAIVRLFVLVQKSGWMRRMEASGWAVKSYKWRKLVLSYGPNRSAIVTITYSISEKCFKLKFGGTTSHNPHTLMRVHIERLLNSPANSGGGGINAPISSSTTTTAPHSSLSSTSGSSITSNSPLDGLMKLLNETYEPLYSLTKLPTTPILNGQPHRPQIPVATFILIPQSPSHVRIVYLNTYCLDIHFQGEGLVSIRDGAFSLFDKTHVLGEFTPMQIPKAFLMKYVDENALSRRRSQSEDDNPPSPISTMMMDIDHGSSTSFLSSTKPQSPAAPGRSNPHTPASPHFQATSTSFSPAGPSFVNLASPPTSSLSHPSPSPSSASLLPAPSPSGGPLSVPTPSPNPNPSSGIGSMGGHPSPFFHGADSSPAAVHSPWGATGGSVGSPGMPRPSPRTDGRPTMIAHRLVPQKSWAGATPTILTYDALDVLCTPVTSVDIIGGDGSSSGVSNLPGHPCSPLERFLGSSYLRRQLQKIVQGGDIKLEMMDVRAPTPGFLHFRSQTMQFRVGHDTNHFQTLHLKITPTAEQWNPEEIRLLETFFGSKVVSPPFRPNGLAAFARMISLPPPILRDCIQIIRLQLYPSIVEQHNWKWNVQLCLTVPYAASQIVPQGMPGIVTSATKILIFLNLTRVSGAETAQTAEEKAKEEAGENIPEKINFVVIPLIYESTTNTTQLAEKRGVGPPSQEHTAISQQLKRFTDLNQTTLQNGCSIFPCVQDLLANLILPSTVPTSGPGPVPGPLPGGVQVGPGRPPSQPMPTMPQGPMVRPQQMSGPSPQQQQMMSPAQQQQFATPHTPNMGGQMM